MILVDTSVWIDFFRNRETDQTEHLAALLETDHILLGDLILYEIVQGVSDEGEAVRVLEELESLPIASMVGHEMALKAARNYRLLRRRGITIRRSIDMLIGTFCIENGHRLLHNDRDFLPIAEHLGLLEA